MEIWHRTGRFIGLTSLLEMNLRNDNARSRVRIRRREYHRIDGSRRNSGRAGFAHSAIAGDSFHSERPSARR